MIVGSKIHLLVTVVLLAVGIAMPIGAHMVPGQAHRTTGMVTGGEYKRIPCIGRLGSQYLCYSQVVDYGWYPTVKVQIDDKTTVEAMTSDYLLVEVPPTGSQITVWYRENIPSQLTLEDPRGIEWGFALVAILLSLLSATIYFVYRSSLSQRGDKRGPSLKA